MDEIEIWTLDWVPEGPRGFVRDLRLRWACREANLPYTVKTIPFEDRATNHLAQQPFGQVPFLRHGPIELFESGACLLHLAGQSGALMPSGAAARADVTEWLFASLNSLEIVTVPWWFLGLSNPPDNPLTDWVTARLEQVEAVLATREWIACGRFTVADLLLADVLRIPKVRALAGRPATEAYVRRMTARPAFAASYAEQIEHFARADADRASSPG